MSTKRKSTSYEDAALLLHFSKAAGIALQKRYCYVEPIVDSNRLSVAIQAAIDPDLRHRIARCLAAFHLGAQCAQTVYRCKEYTKISADRKAVIQAASLATPELRIARCLYLFDMGIRAVQRQCRMPQSLPVIYRVQFIKQTVV